MINPYQVGGPLLGGSPVYISRESDDRASRLLQQMEYITLVEPRQHGKTSLIFRLIGEFASRGFEFAIRDLMAAKASNASREDWYTALGLRILDQLEFIQVDRRPNPPADPSTWETYLAAVAKEAMIAGRKVVIVFDEIGAMPPEWATDFFSIIRSVYTTRQSSRHWQHLTFIISGAFNPRDLIRDKTISNFNIDQRVTLPDFDESQIGALVGKMEISTAARETAARRIFHWTDGQPYLTQYLCEALASSRSKVPARAVDALIDRAVEAFFRDDTSHLPRVTDLLEDPDLLAYTRKITSHTPARFIASLNAKQFRLAHINGIIKSDSNGRCRIRNRIYERALEECYDEVDHRAEKRGRAAEETDQRTPVCLFISYSHKDRRWLERFQVHLKPLEFAGLVEHWDDTMLVTGERWKDAIRNTLATARMAVLLVSADFLASDFIINDELPPLLSAERERGLLIMPVILKPCRFAKTESLAQFQAVNPDLRPMIDLTEGEQEAIWTRLIDDIEASIKLGARSPSNLRRDS
jgi:AAA-like domain/TIR domain